MTTLRLRPDFALVLACLLLYLAAAAQVRNGEQSALALAISAVARPLHAAINATVTGWQEMVDGLRDASATREELRRARAEVDELRCLNQLLAVEVAALREADRLVGSLPPFVTPVAVARVVARDVAGEHIAILDRGRRHGVVRDAPVLAATGVLGRVDRVGETVARVQLLSHPQAAAAARVVGVEQEVLLAGGDWPAITGLPAATVLAEGTPVLTTGSEGIYPSGLTLGFTGEATVDSVLTQVPVRLAVRPSGVEVVVVLAPVARERP